MTYRMTDFGNAEQEQLIQSVSAQLFAVQAGIAKTKAHLDNGNLDAGFRQAQETQKRLDVVEKIISQKRLTGFADGLGAAKVNVTRMWSRFDSAATGRAALGRSNFGDIGDDISGGLDSLSSKAGSLLDKAESYGAKAEDLGAKGSDLWNKFTTAIGGGGGSPLPNGTPYFVPSCCPSDASIITRATLLGYGAPECAAGTEPGWVPVVVGESPSSIRQKISTANAKSTGKPPPAAVGPSAAPARSSQSAQMDRIARAQAANPFDKPPAAQASNGAGILSSIPLTVWLGGGYLALKLFMK